MVRTVSTAAAFGFGGGSPVNNRLAKRRAARRKVFDGYPWEGRFASKQEVEEYLSKDRLICLLCGRAFRKLGGHLLSIHQMDVDQYRERYGIRFGDGLATPESKLKMAQAITPERRDFFRQLGVTSRAKILTERPTHRPRPVWHNPRDNLVGVAPPLVLSEEAINEIRSAAPRSGYVKELAEKYGCSRSTIREIRRNGPSNRDGNYTAKVLNADKVREIRDYYARAEEKPSYKVLAEHFGIDTMTAHNVVNHKTWRDVR